VPTNLGIDEKLLRQAHKMTGLRTKRETVNAALAELVRTRKQSELLRLIGSVEFRKDWDYRKDRREREHRR
jgi:Arc/MetJ family transcription regulator